MREEFGKSIHVLVHSTARREYGKHALKKCVVRSLFVSSQLTYIEHTPQASQEEDYLALHAFVVKVATFMQLGAQNYQLSENIAETLFRYAKVVSEQGLFSSAAKYCR